MRLGRTPLDVEHVLPLWPPLLATRGPGASSGVHAHHAMHLVVAESGELRVRAGESSAVRSAAGVLTPPDVAHAIDASGTDVVLVFLDPESEVGASLSTVLGGSLRLLDETERQRLLEGARPDVLMGAGGEDWARRAVETLGGATALRRTVHPRVKKVLAILRSLPPDGDTSLEALAAAVQLSPGRLMHAFTESIGIPLRPYLQWLKLQRAAAAIVGGMPLAEAAHAAGFADAAHMSRTFRRTLGTPPSALRGRDPRPATS